MLIGYSDPLLDKELITISPRLRLSFELSYFIAIFKYNDTFIKYKKKKKWLYHLIFTLACSEFFGKFETFFLKRHYY